MRSCALGSTIGGLAFVVVLAIGACRAESRPPDVAPVTVAPANPNVPLYSGPIGNATLSDASPVPIEAGAAQPLSSTEPPVVARFVEAPGRVEIEGCRRHIVFAVARGKITAKLMARDELPLGPGDVVYARSVESFEAKGQGLAVLVTLGKKDDDPCPNADAGAAPSIHYVRANAANKLVWAGGKMSANLDLTAALSQELYLGRLEGTAPVAEHTHPGSWEILAAIDAAGSLTLDGKEQRLGPRQVVFVPPGAKHAWKPDQGSKLVAIQMYSPPGPEQRFVTLAAAEKDGGTARAAADAGADAGKR